jgi:hypothetical protein
MYNPDIAAALNFTEQDLITNRRGRITDGQHNRMSQVIASELSLALILPESLIWGVMLLLSTNRDALILDGVGLIFALVILAAPVLLVGAYASFRWRALKNDMRDGTKSVEGQVTLNLQGRKASEIRIGDDVFLVRTQNIYLTFHNDKHYCLYYVPRTKRILSAELTEEQ